jgi:hypothetical protein
MVVMLAEAVTAKAAAPAEPAMRAVMSAVFAMTVVSVMVSSEHVQSFQDISSVDVKIGGGAGLSRAS